MKWPSEDLADAIKAVGALGLTLRLWDDGGLALARELRIDRLPAYAVIDSPGPSGVRRVRTASGYEVKLGELLR